MKIWEIVMKYLSVNSELMKFDWELLLLVIFNQLTLIYFYYIVDIHHTMVYKFTDNMMFIFDSKT